MFRMRRCSPTFLKLTTICDVSHVISFTRPVLSLIFSHKRGRPGYEAKALLELYANKKYEANPFGVATGL